MPRLVEADHCPHCGADLPRPTPVACPSCAGSLQRRHLSAGCLSSAPKLLAWVAFALWCLADQ